MIRRGRAEGRLLATVLFTDLVGSTERAIELGDQAWRALLRRHHAAVRRELRRFGGHEVDSAGDGFFATFPQPADAVRCALAIRSVNRPLGLDVRSAVHTGEVERIGPKVGGVAVHLAARVLSAAEPSEILVTSTVRELVAGSGLTFEDVGTKTFKGFTDKWHTFRVTGPEPAVAEPVADDTRRPVPSRRTAITLGGVSGAALLTGALLVAGITGLQPRQAPGPNSVVRLGPENRIGDVVSVSRGPSAIASADGALWVASEAGTITRVDVDDLTTQVAGGVGIPTSLVAANGAVWVGEAYGGTISSIDAETVQVRNSVNLHSRRLAAGASAVWLTDDVADRVVRLSTTTLEEDGVVALEVGAGPRSISAANGSVWVANERAGTVIEIDAATATLIGDPIGLGSPPTGIAVWGGSVWITSSDADRLYRIDQDQGRVAATVETCDGPDAVVASDAGVWVACRNGRVVQRLDLDGVPVADIPVPGVPSALAAEGDGVWVALRDD